jgi:hypothetical protein
MGGELLRLFSHNGISEFSDPRCQVCLPLSRASGTHNPENWQTHPDPLAWEMATRATAVAKISRQQLQQKTYKIFVK